MSTVTNPPVPKSAPAPVFLPWGRSLSIAALLLLAMAVGLRLYCLGSRSLWYDEAATANASRGTLRQALDETRHFSAPMAHPYLLYLVEKVESTPIAVRIPSVVASLLAVLLMLAMVRAGISPEASIFAAALLACSSSQIRYAQEVREYALAVLAATILIYLFLRWETAGTRTRQPWLLCVALFLAPLVQYGLVLLSGAILASMAIRLLWVRETHFRAFHLAVATASLGAGSLASLLLTLRYQFHVAGVPWYLVADYFDPRRASLLRFLGQDSADLLRFFIPGRLLYVLVALSIAILCMAEIRRRTMHPALLLTFLSLGITIGASIARVYPYGGVRQCLFLAPGVALIAGLAFADLVQRIKVPRQREAATVGVLGIVVVLLLTSLYRGNLKTQWPYGEYEDIQSVLSPLNRGLAPQDQVWVNHDAVPAVKFYQRTKDSRFCYGKFHANPQQYIPDLRAFVAPRTQRIWLIFSHLQQPSDRAEEQLIVHSLHPGWDVHCVAAPRNAELYVANRKAPSVR
jgi:uncharacterized membrane protein